MKDATPHIWLTTAAALLLAVAGACSNSAGLSESERDGAPGVGDGMHAGDVVVVVVLDRSKTECDAFECQNRCGPVTDPCSGETHPCGPCEGGLACDLATHACVIPKNDCAQLGAQCGEIRNTCGIWVNCGFCGDGQECDRRTNACIDCRGLSCEDLGYECGRQWLGCGELSQLTDCGACPSERTCNEAYGVCEPKACSGKSDEQLCEEAAAARGVACGRISNGCGGVIDCSKHLEPCSEGTECGAGGVANRCAEIDRPDECLVEDRECGEILSACTDGKGNAVKLTCGTCTPPAECRDGRCVGGMSCEDHTGHANRQVPKDKTCSNGPAFDDGSGDLTLTCQCKRGANLTCVDMTRHAAVVGRQQGSCCEFDGITECNATGKKNDKCEVFNACLDSWQSCCPFWQYCDHGTCQDKRSCAHYQKSGGVWKDPIPCSSVIYRGFLSNPDNPSSILSCPCPPEKGHLARCLGETRTKAGKCCYFDVEGACASNANSQCQVVDDCTGSVVDCCGPGQSCEQGICEDKLRCGDHEATGSPGSPCGTFPDGVGGSINCPCRTGGRFGNNQCIDGTCECTKRACGSCQDHGEPDGCGRTLLCACRYPQVCQQGVCCTPSPCRLKIDTGQKCTVNTCGATKTCACSRVYSGDDRDVCVGEGGIVDGICDCQPKEISCAGKTGTFYLGCGKSINCGG